MYERPMNRSEITYEPSLYDDLYYELTGSYLAKEGAAYEKLSAAVIGILQKKGVSHDMRIRGQSGSVYQIDGLVEKIIMIEAKDYAKRNHKVSRSDLQKQEGALIDLPRVGEGYFASATGYTKPARQYAEGTKTNEHAKPITPFNIRKSTVEDEKGRIKVIAVKMDFASVEYRPDEFQIVWYDDQVRQAFESALKAIGNDSIGLSFSYLYDDEGNPSITIEEISRSQQPTFKEGEAEVEGMFTVEANIKAFDRLFKIKGIRYKADIVHHIKNFEVKKEGEALLLAQCEDLSIDTLLTDREIKEALRKL